ncbi:hypothetical protein BS47DRAFT_1388124 [Hydnum rufescens UP504]|uniref:Uncharacterized protein n=1 Tax=Hydnum rufescens UP504 TaxID=1448309 RepID=A0A9P6E1I9_9AGAM|nr:hypothetical protein BS47DRAFT_1388124 [Hydnum rufescens UP504]
MDVPAMVSSSEVGDLGLSDGEGCERFWSELRRLIPSLRVMGYHRRLFIIDLQVEHIDELKQQGLAKWRMIALYLLTRGKERRRQGLVAVYLRTVVVEDELQAKIEAMRSSIKRSRLDRLKTDKWVNLQLNICVVQDQILIKLQARKFELAGLDRADTDAEVKFFALLELHHLHDLVEAWQRHSSAMLGSDGQIGWMNLPEQPPPLCYGRIQILCGPVSPVANSLTGEAVDGVSDAASSDDDENGELEDAPVPQDIAFLAALDALEELVGDDA